VIDKAIPPCTSIKDQKCLLSIYKVPSKVKKGTSKVKKVPSKVKKVPSKVKKVPSKVKKVPSKVKKVPSKVKKGTFLSFADLFRDLKSLISA